MLSESKVIDGRFEIGDVQKDLIGVGSMGKVYRGIDNETNSIVAIKALQPIAVVMDQDVVKRFEREGEALRQLNHPNIVKMLGTAVEDDQHFLIMEFVEGGSLRELLEKQSKLPVKDTLQICLGLADALTRAHLLNIIHRDLKPDNVLIAKDGTARLTDFGVAHMKTSPRLTQVGSLVGTPLYLSPEACNQNKELDTRADIWAFGIMLYEMLTGTPPFNGESLTEIIGSILHNPVPDILQYQPDLNLNLADLVHRMLAKDRTQRIPSIRIVGAELEAIMQGREFVVPIALQSRKSTGKSDSALPEKPTKPPKTVGKEIFICYKRHAEADNKMASYLHQFLIDKGHTVFIDQTIRTGTLWLNQIDKQLKQASFLIVLLSHESADSEMVQSEIKRAYEYRRMHGRPAILPVRMAYDELLPYTIDAFLNPFQYVMWTGEHDNARVAEEVLQAIEEGLPNQPPFPAASAHRGIFVSEDGRSVSDAHKPARPLPEFDPRLLEELDAPGGTIKLRDKFYVRRKADDELERQVTRPGAITTIRASRQTGKSSLLVRGVYHARQKNAKIVNLDMQRLDRDDIATPDAFLRYLASFIARKLRLAPETVTKAWQGSLGPQDKLTYFMEDHVLSQTNHPLVLAIDEADRLLDTDYHTDFFGLIRSWHNNAAYEEFWERLNIIMVISTEPYLLISDVNQSPFNVGTKLYLKDFSKEQVQDLNRQHGSPVGDAHFSEFMTLFNGHPYLTRKALYTLVSEQLRWTEFIKLAASDKGPFNDHLRRQLWLLREEPNLLVTLKQAVFGKQCKDEVAHFRLLKAGLVKGTGEVCQCRCDLYRRYFESRL